MGLKLVVVFAACVPLQLGFFKALVCPMYAMLTSVAPECHELQDSVLANLAFWKAHPSAPPSLLTNALPLPKLNATSATTTDVFALDADASASPLLPPAPASATLPGSLMSSAD